MCVSVYALPWIERAASDLMKWSREERRSNETERMPELVMGGA